MKKLRVLLLCHEELVPLDSIDGLSDEEISDWRTEFDVVNALRELGHETEVLGVGDEIDVIRAKLAEFRPHICFNLMVEFHGAADYDQHIPSYLELHRTPYTGCNPRGLTLARDKALSKKILGYHGVPVPQFAVFPMKRAVRRPRGLDYPLFVKSATEEASLGISRKSIVKTDLQLAERVRFFHENIHTDAIAEEYIDGREFYVGVIGNTRLETFPIWELNIPGLAKGAPRIATRRLKWDVRYQKAKRIKNHQARDLTREQEQGIVWAAKEAYRALGLTGFARMDIRMRPDGRFYILEANPNPDLTFGEDFAESAEAAGLSYEELVQRILQLGLKAETGWKKYAALA